MVRAHGSLYTLYSGVIHTSIYGSNTRALFYAPIRRCAKILMYSYCVINMKNKDNIYLNLPISIFPFKRCYTRAHIYPEFEKIHNARYMKVKFTRYTFLSES